MDGAAPPPPLRKGRYFLPRGGLFELVACPNYLGELVQWAGFALAAGGGGAALAWAAFGAATFVPRSRDHLAWYRATFKDDFPRGRRALVPFVW